MRFIVETIPHDHQRYPTCGDWWWDGDTLQMRVSELGDWRMEACIAYHELFEALACLSAEVSQESVDAFDREYEANRKLGEKSEPGDDPRAPYYQQHQAAMVAERHLANVLGVRWVDYEERLGSL